MSEASGADHELPEAGFERVVSAAARQYGRGAPDFPDELFRRLVRRHGLPLWEALGEGGQRVEVLAAYLRLLAEGVVCGYLRRVVPQAGPCSNLFELALLRRAPQELPSLAPDQRLPALAKAWNLSEGLARQPAWLRRYVLLYEDELRGLAALERPLRRLVTMQGGAAGPGWGGPLTTTVLDPAASDEEFLPGELHFAGPSLVCVHDRLRPQRQLGLALRSQGRSALVGVFECPGAADVVEGPFPNFSGDGSVRVGSREATLPHFRQCRAFATTESGFLVAATSDSQRLWVVAAA